MSDFRPRENEETREPHDAPRLSRSLVSSETGGSREETPESPAEPLSDPDSLDADLDRFVARLRARLVGGAVTYGASSFTRPAVELVDEIQQELEDVCGWAPLLWIRLDRVRRSAARIGEKDGEHG